jgi:hypothetical protein
MNDPRGLAHQVEWCPGCGSSNLWAVIAGGQTNVLCRECGCCWHAEGSRFRPVDPRDCPGCPSQPVCIRRLWEPLQQFDPAGEYDRGDAARHELWS